MCDEQKNTLSIELDFQDPESKDLINKIKELCEEHEIKTNLKTNVKASLEFDLNDSDAQRDFAMMVSSKRVYKTLYRIRQEIFRPARKHGYSDKKISLLLENSGGHDSFEIDKNTKFVTKDEMDKDNDKYYGNGEALIGLLEEKYSEILEEESVDEDLYF